MLSAADLSIIGFRPPDGSTLLYDASVDGTFGLYTMKLDGTNPRLVLQAGSPGNDDFWGGSAWSADGSQIYYTRPYAQATAAGTCCSLWVANADGSEAHQFIPNDGTRWDGVPSVSPDGKLVAFWRGGDHAHVEVAPVGGDGRSFQTGPEMTTNADWVWSPDSSKILMTASDGSVAHAYLLNPAGGVAAQVPWSSDSDLDWQRLALP